MNVSTGLMAKGTAGALAATAAIGAGIAAKNSDLFNPYRNLNKFDRGLIEFLDADGDIKFDVKKDNVDLTANHLFFDSTSTSPLTIKVSVLVGKNEMKLFEKIKNLEEKGKKEYLQKLNGNGKDEGTPWTWSCEVKFVTSETLQEGKSIHNKDKISSSSKKGLFDVLKKYTIADDNVEEQEEEKKEKRAKKRFIKACADARDNKNIKGQTLSGNKLESSITINLKLGVEGQGDKNDTSKLYPSDVEDDRKFSELFG